MKNTQIGIEISAGLGQVFTDQLVGIIGLPNQKLKGFGGVTESFFHVA